MDIDIESLIDEHVSKITLLKANRILELNYVTPSKTINVNEDDIEYNFKCISESIAKKVYLIELNFYKTNYTEFEEYDEYYDYTNDVGYFDLIPSCTCKQHESDIYCKHIVACMLYLDKKILNNNSIGSDVINKEPKIEDHNEFNQYYSYKTISEYHLFAFLSYAKKNKIYNDVINNDIVKIINETENKSLTATVTLKKDVFNVKVKKSTFGITANCSCLKKDDLCEHSTAVLYHILKTKKNGHYLDTLINIEEATNELLHNYGITSKDEEAKYFEFYFEEEALKMRSKKGMVTSLTNWETGSYLKNSISKNKVKKEFVPSFSDGYICILKTYNTYPELRWEVFNIAGSLTNITAIENRLDTTNLEDLEKFCKPDALFIYNATAKGLAQYFVKNKIMGSSYGYIYTSEYELRNFASYKTLEYRKGLFDYYSKEWERLVLTNNYYTSTAKGNKHKLTDIVKLNFSAQPIKIHLKFSQVNKFCKLEASIKIDEDFFEISEFTNYNFLLLVKNNTAYLPQNEITYRMLMNFENKRELIFPESEAQALIKEYLLPLRKDLSIDLPEEVMPTTLQAKKSIMAVKLTEQEPNLLLLQPLVKYDDYEAELNGEDIEVLKGEKIVSLTRDDEKETLLKSIIINLHANFEQQQDEPYFYLPFSKALEKGWFFEAIKTLAENNIEIYGQKELKKFKYNSNKAAFSIGGGSGIDWFDLTIELSFGDQIVPLKALKQALINNQDYVQLGDGTLGILPQEWIKKMTTLFKIGNIKNDGELQVSKFHYTLIDEMHDAINADEILQELEQKKQQLNQIDNIVNIKKPKNISATLRPYQLSGLNWFNQLHTIGWGGCLADDMGLGKTLQTLCFFQKLHDENKKIKLLIVCPTSLIYNWQAEIDKFTKGLNYVIFHGSDRVFPKPSSNNWNILITSYGTLRNSLKEFQTLQFDVTVLDESQAIKNPISQVTKAVQLINTKLRFILSGTPVQNNTFDLYAQLNFCNPGLLGNQEFFKSEFAIPIDKNGDTEKSQQLRKMVFPFILRRTKEQVAKDLPDKTETVMYCEMSSYQQKVYDSVKEDYKLRILGKIDEQGVAKSAFLILEGLNKLRQICDCPSLVNNEDTKKFKSDSVKLNELSREIEENISNHKMLVFSQFLGMLSLVKDKLDKDGIKYIYLDGSTPAKDRKGLVDQFQTDPTIQVFLISLKAGGVGLNLTAADYVYIIDPWWNPAVEDQAIDRTHRIGQNKKVFAYKMICKNTIEEKIMQLQAKKKSLAKELISEDASFVKKLTRDDVAWLLT